MAKVVARMSMSLDGYISGPEHLDAGFFRVQQWAEESMAFRERHGSEGGQANEDSRMIEEMDKRTGAYVMGRRMFDVGVEPWGESPPFRAAVFVVTHNAAAPLPREGGTTFSFVTDGVRSAVDQALEAAGGKDVQVSGGANLLQQVIEADLLDELELHVSPVLLGDGIPLFNRGRRAPVELVATDVVDSPTVTHMRFAFKR